MSMCGGPVAEQRGPLGSGMENSDIAGSVAVVVVVVGVQNTKTLQVRSTSYRSRAGEQAKSPWFAGSEEWRQTIPVIHAELRNDICSQQLQPSRQMSLQRWTAQINPNNVS